MTPISENTSQHMKANGQISCILLKNFKCTTTTIKMKFPNQNRKMILINIAN